MEPSAKRFFNAIIGMGALSLAAGLYPFISENPLRYLAFLAAAVAASRMRLSLPNGRGPLSLSFVFVLIGIIALSRSETMLLACLVTALQSIWDPARRSPWRLLLFNVANLATAVLASYTVYHSWSFPDLSIDMPLRLLLATAVYFVLNSFPVAVAISVAEKRSLASAWHEGNTWSFPYYMVGAIAAAAFSFLKHTGGWPTFLLLLPFIYVLYRHYRLYLARLEAEKKHADEINGLHLRTIEALALAIAKDQNSHSHLDRIQRVAVFLGERLGVDGFQLEALRAAALLHDIGKLAVPEHIASKPGFLTREEFEKLKIHPRVGGEILERVNFPYPVVPIVRHHHEKWDGSGYPDGLAGENIPIGARVLRVAGAYEALTTGASYQKPVTPVQALAQIESESGVSYDPRVVQGLRRWQQDIDLLLDPANFLVSIAAARQEAQALFELAQELGNSLSLDETLSVFAVRLRRTVPYDSIAIFVRRDALLRPEYVSGENVRIFSALEIPIGAGLSGWVARHRKPLLNGNPWMEPGYKEEPGRSTPLRAALPIPLEGIPGVVGVLSLYRAEKDSFTRDHLRFLQAISTKVAMSIENALKYRQAESSASTDYLTGLLNARSLFLHLDSELARCRRLDSPLAILVSDLDGFKQVNDRFGHLEGNKLLQLIALGLKETCREYDCVARMGGDEFVLVLPGLTPEAVKTLIPRLRETVKRAGQEVLPEDIIGFSVGEAYFPADGADAEQLLAQADRRMIRSRPDRRC
ncbi:MAG TPA: HD domain-containing phosphohydrolase [Bryobacteraceae bacterium]|nr:HD domain-containing phosphohydrolase [Bryobacteraceae bacterium]